MLRPFLLACFRPMEDIPVPFANKPEYIESILRLIHKESAQVILPGTEAENEILITHRHEFEQAGCTLIANPEQVIKLCANKWRLYNWLTDNGFGTPQTVRANDWPDLVSKTGFPIVGKPTESTGGFQEMLHCSQTRRKSRST